MFTYYMEKVIDMLYKKLKQIRKHLHLSQEYVAKVLKMTEAAVAAIEAGARKITLEELTEFSKLYGVNINELLYEENFEDAESFAHMFVELSSIDKKEIMNLINFKKRYKASLDF